MKLVFKNLILIHSFTGSVEVVVALLENGADQNLLNENCETALATAEKMRSQMSNTPHIKDK